MAKPTRSHNDKLLAELERLFEAADDERYKPVDHTALVILEEVESAIGGPEDPGPPRDREFFELAVARALEKCGRTTAQIAAELGEWMAAFGEGEADRGRG